MLILASRFVTREAWWKGETRMTISKVSILLHEDRTGPGVLISFEATHTGRDWLLTNHRAERIPEVSEVEADLAVINDTGAEGLILQFLGEKFGGVFAGHLFNIFTRRCGEHGMHLPYPAQTSD